MDAPFPLNPKALSQPLWEGGRGESLPTQPLPLANTRKGALTPSAVRASGGGMGRALGQPHGRVTAPVPGDQGALPQHWCGWQGQCQRGVPLALGGTAQCCTRVGWVSSGCDGPAALPRPRARLPAPGASGCIPHAQWARGMHRGQGLLEEQDHCYSCISGHSAGDGS